MDNQDPNNQVMPIDSEISGILGLEDNFDLDPDEYLQLIRAKLVEYDILSSSKNITPEQQEEQRILASQVRDIRAQKRTGEVKYNTGKVSKKINVDSFFGRKSEETKEPEKRIVDPSKLLPGTAKTGEITKGKSQKVEDLKNEKPEEENKELFTISKILNSILDSLKDKFKFDQKKSEDQRKEKETKKREKRESGLEKGFAMAKSAVKKMLAPFQNILDQIFKYFFFTFLGKMFTDLMNWLKDPANKKKVEVLGRFLKDWWPALAFAAGLFLTPFGAFIRTTIGAVRAFIPQLIALTTNPAFLALAGATAGGIAGASLESNLRKVDETLLQRRIKESKDQGKPLSKQEIEKIKLEQLQKRVQDVTGTNLPGSALLASGGIVPRFSMGGINFGTGYDGIDGSTGQKVSGFGPDTQAIIAQPGEIVINKKTVDAVGSDHFLALNRQYGGPGANKPKMGRLYNGGGEVERFQNGGMVGSNKSGQVGKGNPKINQSDYNALLAISALEDDKPQGRSDVAQSLYNRILAAQKYETNFNQVGNSLKDLITAPQQYEPTFSNRNDWLNIKDRNSAAIAIMNSKKGRQYKWTMKDAMDQLKVTESAIKNPTLQLSSQKHVGGRAYFLGTSQQENMKPGDVLRGDKHNFFSPWYLEGTPYDKERRNIAAPIPEMLLPPKQRTPTKPQNQNIFQSTFSQIGNLIRPPSSSAKQRTPAKPQRWAMDPRGWFGMQGGGPIDSNKPQPQLFALPGLGGGGGGTDAITEQAKDMPLGDRLKRLLFGGSKRGYDPQEHQGGGSIMPVTSKTGIPTSKLNIEAGADTQFLPQYNAAVQQGEQIFKYVIPKDAVEKGAGTKLLQLAHQVVGDNDSNSTAAKIGFRNKSINIKPPANRLNNSIIVPPIKAPSSGGIKGSSAANSQDVMSFSPVLETAGDVRKMHVDMYEILD